MPAEPNRNPLRLILVGEGPGRTEIKLGRPFVGLSGKLLDQLLARNKIRRSECFILNAALCRGESDKDNEKAAVYCAPRLLRELSSLPASIPIVTLGKSATHSVLGLRSSFLQTRGFVWQLPPTDPKKVEAQRRSTNSKQVRSRARAESDLKLATLVERAKLGGRMVLPTIHPAFVLRADVWHAIARLDMARVGRVLRSEVRPPWEDSRARTDVLSSLRALSRLWRLGATVSLDVETTQATSPLKAKLLCVGLSDGLRTYVIWPWRAIWAKPLSKFLRTRTGVIGHNSISFDKVVLERHGVS